MKEKQYPDYFAREPLKRIPCTLQRWGIIELMKAHQPGAVIAVGGRFEVGIVMRHAEFQNYVTEYKSLAAHTLSDAMLALKKAGLIKQTAAGDDSGVRWGGNYWVCSDE